MFDKGVVGRQNIQIVYWWLFWLDCFCDDNGRWMVVEGWSENAESA